STVFCQPEPVKTLGWLTLTPILELHDVPTQFTTTSRLALIGNDWKTLNADVAALEDRGHVLFFEPAPLEVHRQAAGWFWDQEIPWRLARTAKRWLRVAVRRTP